MEFFTAIVGPVVESLMVPVKKHLRYLISCTEYVANMHTKKRALNDTRLGVENHMKSNKSNNLEIPTQVGGWLEEVGNIDAQVESIPSDVGSCFNLKARHKLGRKASKITIVIDRLIEEKSRIDWTGHPIPLGKVDSMKASTSTPSTHHNDFKSREPTFMEALKALEPDHKSHMIALCGMGGVGKTVMVQKLNKAVSEKKLFDFIIEATIGEKVEVLVIQQAIADFLGLDLKESSKAARAIKLRKSFEALSDGGKKKFLIILDDVWQFVDLDDIGLSPLPNQGINFKVLLTSRDRSVCTMMGVEVNSILDVKVIENSEAHKFFFQFVKVSDDDDPDLELCEIGKDIVNRCQGLPIAIKTIARTLKGKRKHVWEDTRSRIESKNVDEAVRQVFEISYKNLHDEETRSTLLLCCLFPEDFATPIEDLVRYGWGLRIFNEVDSIRKARNRLNTCIERLIDANLLIQSKKVGCVKMHDLVRDFVLHMCSKGEHASVVGDMSKWPAKHMSEFCKRISISCTGMSEFPRDRKFTNLLLLKLMNGEKSFPEDFYQEMKKLEVIVYERMRYPLIPISLQYSSNLRVLCIYRCSFTFDCSPVGDLLNLEVLSFTYCAIKKLPSTLGNLKKLKILDLTGCRNLCIDYGVLNSLVNLEEFCMRGVRRHAGIDGDESVECSKKLEALEIEFSIQNVGLPKNMSFEKLERFKISLGCFLERPGSFKSAFGRWIGLDYQNIHSSENTLMLETNKGELLDSRLNVLFGKTKVLHMQVDGINNLGDCLGGESLPHLRCSFFSLRVLRICKCANLRYLFTIRVANGLKQLEVLDITNCPVLETLVDSHEICEVEVIKFPSLKFLYLNKLPMLTSLCKGGNVIELPLLEVLKLDTLPKIISIHQHFLNEECYQVGGAYWSSYQYAKSIVIHGCNELLTLIPSHVVGHMPNPEKLRITHCDSLREIFESDEGVVKSVANIGDTIPRPIINLTLPNLQTLHIDGCNNMEYIFTSCVLESLKKLQELKIEKCYAIQVIVKHEDDQGLEDVVFPYLTSLTLVTLPNLKGFFLGKNEFRWPLLDEVKIYGCPQMMIFTPGLSMSPKLKYINTGVGKHSLECGLNFDWTNAPHEKNKLYNSSWIDADIIELLQFPWSFSNLIELDVRFPHGLCMKKTIFGSNELVNVGEGGDIEEADDKVFEDETQSANNDHLSNKKQLLMSMDHLPPPSSSSSSYIWKINSPNLSNLTKLSLQHCNNLEHVFSYGMAATLVKLQDLHIRDCNQLKVIVEAVKKDSANKVKLVSFPCLKSLQLTSLVSLKGFCLGSHDEANFEWPSLYTLKITKCPEMTIFTNGQSTTPELKVIETGFGLCEVTEDLNSFIKTKLQEGYKF